MLVVLVVLVGVRAPKAVVLAVLGPQRLLGAHAQACAAMVNI